MLPESIKVFLTRTLSSIFAISLFIIMLPLTIAIAAIMLLTGLVTMATLRYQWRKRIENMNSNTETVTTKPHSNESVQKPPIEGSYTVIDK